MAGLSFVLVACKVFVFPWKDKARKPWCNHEIVLWGLKFYIDKEVDISNQSYTKTPTPQNRLKTKMYNTYILTLNTPLAHSWGFQQNDAKIPSLQKTFNESMDSNPFFLRVYFHKCKWHKIKKRVKQYWSDMCFLFQDRVIIHYESKNCTYNQWH